MPGRCSQEHPELFTKDYLIIHTVKQLVGVDYNLSFKREISEYDAEVNLLQSYMHVGIFHCCDFHRQDFNEIHALIATELENTIFIDSFKQHAEGAEEIWDLQTQHIHIQDADISFRGHQ